VSEADEGAPIRGVRGHEQSDDHSGPPTFTVVVPAFNAAATLASCVGSILQQTVSNFEVVIVDDGSTDDTLQLARSVNDPRVQVHSQDNAGLPAARNAGISVARNEVVCFLDSDDVLLPRYLETVQAAFAADPEVDFVYTDAWTFDDRTRRVRKHTTAHYQRPPRPSPSTALGMFRELTIRNFIIVPVAVRREVIVAAGQFDEKMTSAEDWDMWLRLSAAGHRSAEAAGPLGMRREHSAQMSANVLRMVQNQVYMFEKLLREQDLLAQDEARVRARLALARRECQILSGEDRPRAVVRSIKWRLGRVRRGLGLGARWYRQPPTVVTAAFGDLSSL
jgi:glycosyltransferase involved in cell wall biosynthesis